MQVDLCGCTLVRGKTNRFQVVKLGEEDRTHNLVGLEVSASKDCRVLVVNLVVVAVVAVVVVVVQFVIE